MKKIPIGRISYINVSPIYHGMDHGECPEWLAMKTLPPATLNAMLKSGEVVMSPVSSAAYARNASEWLLLPDFSISCNGKVLSVLFVSEVPMEALTEGDRVMVTEESATSVDLLRILLGKRGAAPVLEPGRVHAPSDLLPGVRGALVIGDAALLSDWRGAFPYVYDLGEEWKMMTGLPFVFAVWAIRREFCILAPAVVEDLVACLNRSRANGLANRRGIVEDAHVKTGLSPEILNDYFNHLVVTLGPEEIEGMTVFFDELAAAGILPEKITPAFALPLSSPPSEVYPIKKSAMAI